MSATLEATFSDLALAGNYFADGMYLAAQPADGKLVNRGGTRLCAVPDDLMICIQNAAAAALGSDAADTLYAAGHKWGRRAATMFGREVAAFYGKRIAELPMSVALAALQAAFRAHGWGRLEIDLSRFATGILVATLHDPIIGIDVTDGEQRHEHMTAGYLAGFLSSWAETDLDCLQTSGPAPGVRSSTFVLTVPRRLRAAAKAARTGVVTHDDIIAQIEQARVA